MCFKYEDQYEGQCWDYLFFSEEQKFVQMEEGDGTTIQVLQSGSGESLVDLLRDVYNVKIVNQTKFDDLVLELFGKMHDQGIIAPAEQAT